MNFNFAEALARIPAGTALTVANAARPAATYLFNTLLPEQQRYDYQAKSGTMTVRSMMAGLVGMDSPYPPTGVVDASTFNEQTAKIANTAELPEATLRQLQQMLMQLMATGQPTTDTVTREALNFLDKVIVQGHLDAMEYLRGQAIATGMIDWTFNGKRLQVDYGVPAANKLTPRSGNDAYGGSTSKFWEDVRAIRRLLRGEVRAILAHPDTIDAVRYNTANQSIAISEANGGVTLQRVNGQGLATRDVADTITLVSYAGEGEVLNPADGTTKRVPFMPRGVMVGIGNVLSNGYVVGAGSTPAPQFALGYTHLAPTVENGGRPGRWAELYVPESRPWTIVGRGVTNGLPVIEAPEKIVIATTVLA